MKKSDLLEQSGDIHISLILSRDKKIKKLNQKYLKRDYPTDVLAFEMKEELEDGDFYLGDVIVNIEQAERQAAEYGNTLKEEIAALVEHGVLHLLGVHHEGDDHSGEAPVENKEAADGEEEE
jgi:probable rRNA maturation factor